MTFRGRPKKESTGRCVIKRLACALQTGSLFDDELVTMVLLDQEADVGSELSQILGFLECFSAIKGKF